MARDRDTLRRTHPRGGTAALWTPNAVPIADRGFWGDSSSFEHDGTDIQTWTDLWGGSDVLTSQGTTEIQRVVSARFRSGIAAQLSEAAVNYFSGALAAASYVAMSNGGPVTIGFAYYTADSDDTQLLSATCNMAATNVGHGIRARGASAGIGLGFGDGVDFDTVNTDSVAALSAVHTIAFDQLGLDWRLYVDRSLVSSGTIDAVSAAAPGGAWRVGARSPTANEYFTGEIETAIWFRQRRANDLIGFLESRVVR